MKHYRKKEFMNVVSTYGRCFYSEQDDILYFNWTNSSIEVKFTGKMLVGTFRFVPDNRIITKMGRGHHAEYYGQCARLPVHSCFCRRTGGAL